MRSPVRAHLPRGFTLLELLVTMTVVVVLGAIAVPALSNMIINNRMATQANALVTSLNYARSEAVSAARTVRLCPYTENSSASTPATRYACKDSTSWTGGWMVYRPNVDETGAETGGDEILRVFDPVHQGDTLIGSAKTISYQSNGFLRDASAPSFTLNPSVCHDHQKRSITLSLQGRPRVASTSC